MILLVLERQETRQYIFAALQTHMDEALAIQPVSEREQLETELIRMWLMISMQRQSAVVLAFSFIRLGGLFFS